MNISELFWCSKTHFREAHFPLEKEYTHFEMFEHQYRYISASNGSTQIERCLCIYVHE